MRRFALVPKRKVQSRYHLAGASMPAQGFGRPRPSDNVRTAVGAVVDPMGNGRERHLVTINRLVDVLEDERAHRRISEAAYQVGRIAQAVFERARGPGSSNWQGASRIDAFTVTELAVIHSLDDARRIVAMVEWLRSQLGRIDANVIQRVLGEGKSYAEVAALQGKSGERGISYIAARFRDALEALAEAKAARGPRHRRQP